MEYYIYHIPGHKIGCTSDLQKRMQDQGFTTWEILEVHTDIYEASNREIELQKEYGLPVDAVQYWQSVKNRRKFTKEEMSRGGKNSIAQLRSKLNKEALSRGGRASRGKSKPWVKPSKLAQSNGGKAGRNLTFEQAEEIRSKYIPRKYTAKMLSNEYKVSLTTIHKIIHRTSYTQP